MAVWCCWILFNAGITQLVESLPSKQVVVGSSPSARTMVTDEIVIALLREDGLDAFKRHSDSPNIVVRYKDEYIAFWLRDGCVCAATMDCKEWVGSRFHLSDPNWIDELKVWLDTWKGPIGYA